MNEDFSLTPAEAITMQERLREKIETADRLGTVSCVGGVDVGFLYGGRIARGAVVNLSYPELQFIESVVTNREVSFPYIPGLLSFREIPVILEALEKLRRRPDLLLVDGQGLAHPRRCGLASHLGLLADLPSIGVAKSRLIGSHEPVPDERGAWRLLYDGEEVIGAALRTRPGVKVLYVSIGHRISLQKAIEYVMQTTRGFRLPEPLRLAHQVASKS